MHTVIIEDIWNPIDGKRPSPLPFTAGLVYIKKFYNDGCKIH